MSFTSSCRRLLLRWRYPLYRITVGAVLASTAANLFAWVRWDHEPARAAAFWIAASIAVLLLWLYRPLKAAHARATQVVG